MKKCSRCRLLVIPILLTLHSCTAPSIELHKTTQLPHYPSASALVLADEGIYVIGDDARQVLLLDKNHVVKDSILLFANGQGRMQKDDKPDFESAVLVSTDGKRYVLAIGSFATAGRCRFGWINPQTKKLERVDTIAFPVTGIPSLNIEGSAVVKNRLVLANRANRSYPQNSLLVLDWLAGTAIESNKPTTIELNFSKTETVTGLSDLFYDAKNDWLFFTASTEQTDNAYSDGVISDSYIGYVKNFSEKLQHPEITPDVFLNLKPHLGQLQAYKIEGLAVEEQNNGKLIVHLAADNDDGQSTLFKLHWRVR